MLKTELCSGITQYTFDPRRGQHFGYNIFALRDGGRVLLLDTGYEEHALQVLDDLRVDGLTIEKIVISHFHDDHIYGLKVLPRAEVYGSAQYQVTLDRWTPKEDHPIFVPEVKVNEPMTLTFGPHSLILIPLVGHSVCELLTVINGHYLHVADELMTSNDGVPLLPGVAHTVQAHYNSLQTLLDYTRYELILSHGRAIVGEGAIRRAINARLSYLGAILANPEPITYQAAVKDCGCTFLHPEWHRHAYPKR